MFLQVQNELKIYRIPFQHTEHLRFSDIFNTEIQTMVFMSEESELSSNDGIILEKLIIRNSIPYRTSELKFKQFNLLIGKNGSGKSTLLRILHSTFNYNKNYVGMDSNVEFHYSDGVIEKLTESQNSDNQIGQYVAQQPPRVQIKQYFTEITTVNLKIEPQSSFHQHAPFTKLEYDDKLMEQTNEKLSNLFQRKIKIRSIEQRGRLPFYEKNGKFINPGLDGTGIATSFPLIEFLLFTKNAMIMIEEPTAFLHPSAIPPYLKIIFELAERNNNQLFITTHDIITALQFFKGIYEKNSKISVHRLDDNHGEINITSIDQDNITGSLDEFLGEFPFYSDIKQLNDLSGCYP
ncbi:MAG: AAA family ATPase [Nitrosopumilus sp.]|nr:MAG: AAA family ATPase [Nitrosopumilus sp.]